MKEQQNENIFDVINEIIRDSESALVNLLSAIAPWAAPLAPAFMSYSHMTIDLEFPILIAVSVAVVVEILGLSTVSTILEFWSYNKRKDVAEFTKAPISPVVFSFVFYLAIILLMNVGLDASGIPSLGLNKDWMRVAANALLTLLSIPAAIILAVRTQHKGAIDSYKREKREKRLERMALRTQGGGVSQRTNSTTTPTTVTGGRKKNQFMLDMRSGKLEELLDGAEPTPKNIAPLYDVDERSVYRWLSALKTNGNGKGEPVA